MVFNSWEFAYLLAVVMPLYFVLRTRAQNVILLVASYVFYGWWDWRFLSLLWITTLMDYAVGRKMGSVEPRYRRKWLLISLVINLGMLGVFKYANFFQESAADLLNVLGIPFSPVVLQIVLPVGISFYTFQSLAYTIDVYRGHMKPSKDLLTFALFVAYFPQLVAGPIERAPHLYPELAAPRKVRGHQIVSGLALVLVGLVRKVAIADFLAGIVDETFATPDQFSSFRLLIGLYSFAIQIYCDFAGYSDIARGCSRMLGIELMINFRRPYGAGNITEFWRRWHISFSTWLRDYLYIPLGGNRYGEWNTYRNLMITMLLGGLWHGASWNFVIWGGLHGLYLAVHKLSCTLRGISPKDPPPTGIRGFLLWVSGMFITFHLVCLSWIFFRAGTLTDASQFTWRLLTQATGTTFADYLSLHQLLMATGVLLAIDGFKALAERRRMPFASLNVVLQGAYVGALLLILLVLGDRVNVPFIYFQF